MALKMNKTLFQTRECELFLAQKKDFQSGHYPARGEVWLNCPENAMTIKGH